MASRQKREKFQEAADSASRAAEDATSRSKTIDSYAKPILITILVLGALLRIVYLVSIQSNPDYSLPIGDATYKHFWARAILTGDATPAPGEPNPELATSPYLRPPAYPFFLAFVYLLTGYSLTAVRVIQMILGLVSCWLLYRFSKRIFSESVALLATFLMSTYWFLIFFEAEINSPALIVFLVLCILNLVEDWRHAPSLKTIALSGLCFGVLALDRPETLLFLPVLLAWGFFAGSAVAPARRVMHLALVPLVIALCIAPVTLRNYIRSGEPVLICTIGGLNLYAANNPDATGYFPDLDYGKLFGVSQTLTHQNFPQLVQALERKTGEQNLTQADLQTFFIQEATRFIRENPDKTMSLALTKLAYFWGPHEISSDKVFELEKQNSAFLRYFPPFWSFMPFALVGLASFIAAQFLPRLRRHLAPGALNPALLVFGFVAAVCITHMIFFVVARFRIPVIPFVLLFSAFGIMQIILAVRQRDTRVLTAYTAVLVAGAFLFAIPWVPYEASKARFHFQRGMTYAHLGRVGEAIQEFLAASEAADDQSPDICSELGLALAKQGEFGNALFWYNKATNLDTAHAISHRRKADALVAQGKSLEAVESYQAAIAADFTDFDTRLVYARLLVRLGRLDEALAVAAEGEAIAPGNYQVHLIRSEIASQQGNHAKALEETESALAMRPQDASLLTAKGLQLAALGRYDEAIQSYEQAIAVDPDNSTPRTNLGNLYAHLQQYDNAIVHYMDALIINGNDAGAEYGWGFVDAQRGDIDRAIERMRLALSKQPDYLEANNYLGYLYLQKGILPNARFYLEHAVRLNPNFLAARVNLGDVYARMELYPEAVEQYQAAAALAPQDQAIAQALEATRAKVAQPKVRTEAGEKVLLFPSPGQ